MAALAGTDECINSFIDYRSTGILLNNEMDDFSSPGEPNSYGLAPSEANFIAPGKRPLSSMSPTIVTDRDGKVWAVAGGSGGPRIITATAQVLLNVIARGMAPLDAVNAPRLVSSRASLLVHLDWIHSDIAGICFMRIIAYFFCGVLTGFFC